RCLGFAISVHSRCDSRERIVKMARFGALVVERAIGQGEIHLAPGPIERCARAGSFLQGFAEGRDGLLESRRPALPLAEHPERKAEIVLGRGPLERSSKISNLWRKSHEVLFLPHP